MNSPPLSKNRGLYFRDGVTKIDMILAYVDDSGEEEVEEDEEDRHITKKQKRENFENNLRQQGLLLELEPKEVTNSSG